MEDTPAPIVSPPRRIKILPMSLFTENGSIGMGSAFAEGPDVPLGRRDICTSADAPFVSTLIKCAH